jgi:hypothetical protein
MDFYVCFGFFRTFVHGIPSLSPRFHWIPSGLPTREVPPTGTKPFKVLSHVSKHARTHELYISYLSPLPHF